MTREEAKRILYVFRAVILVDASHIEAFEMAIKALEQEPCEDAISRQAVLDGLASIAKAKAKSDEQKALMGRVMFFTEQLPPVTPQPKIGHWEWVQYDYNPNIGNWHCSECNRIVCGAIKNAANPIFYAYNYCPNCGAKMAESEVQE